MNFKIGLLFLVVLFFFQNCSRVNLEPLPLETAMSSAKPESFSCAPEGTSFTAPMRFVFIVDMSMSNVGTLKTVTNDGKTTYSLDTSDGPSDLQGHRFTQVRNFIANCGSLANSKYAVIGFSETTLLENNQSCFSEFENKENAIKSIDALKGRQTHDLSISSREQQNPYYLQGQTYYSAGLNCAKNKITSELAQLLQEKPIYKVFFITDGMTTDLAANKNYKQILNELKSQTATKAGGMSFFPVFYTSPGAKNQGQQLASAQSLMDEIAHEVDPNQKTILLTDITSKKDSLCQYIQPSVPVNYELNQFYAINISAVMKKNVFLVDTDGDGFSDADEMRLGYNPAKSHSGVFHDALCLRLGLSLAECDQQKNDLICEREPFNFFGLSPCDEQISIKLFGKKISSVDSDKDAVPDWLELVRNMNPLRVDTFESPFADGLYNFIKLSKGLDILSNFKLYPVEDRNILDFRLFESPQSCSGSTKRYDYQIGNIPFVDTLAYEDENKNLDLSHAENENVLLVFSYWKSMGGIDLPTKMYVQKIRVNKNKSDYELDDYKYIGEQ